VVIRLEDGGTVVGRIVKDDFRESRLSVATDPYAPGQWREIAKDEIESYEESPVSPMPPGLLNTRTKEEILDLLGWLRGGPPGEASPGARP